MSQLFRFPSAPWHGVQQPDALDMSQLCFHPSCICYRSRQALTCSRAALQVLGPEHGAPQRARTAGTGVQRWLPDPAQDRGWGLLIHLFPGGFGSSAFPATSLECVLSGVYETKSLNRDKPQLFPSTQVIPKAK